MEKDIKKTSVWVTILKVVGIIVLSLVVIFVGGYLYLKYALGFDLGKFKRAVELLNRSYNENTVITNKYSDSNIVDGFEKMFGENSIYTEQDGKYVFDKEAYGEATLQDDTLLSDKEFCGILNLFMSTYLEDYFGDDANTQLKQVIFSNLVEGEDSISVDIQFSIKLGLFGFNEGLQIPSFFKKYIPQNFLLTSKICLTYSKIDCYNYSYSSINFRINGLTSGETNEILDTLTTFGITKNNNEIADYINRAVLTISFGGEGEEGFVARINGSNGYDFILKDGSIYLKLKKL